MSLNSRVCLAVGVDSVGHEVYYERLFEKMKIPFRKNNKIMLQHMGRRRDYDKDYQAQPKRKRKRAEIRFGTIKEGTQKQMADKAMGLAYETGMNLMEQNNDMTEKQKSQKTVCKACGASSHKTRRAKVCKYNLWSEEAFREEL